MTQDYYGTKRVTAWPAQKASQEKPELMLDGYGVKYEDGYTSWSPKEVFEKAYQPTHALSFGHALEVLKAGGRVARAGWNGKGMWIDLMQRLHDPCAPETYALPELDYLVIIYPFGHPSYPKGCIVPWLLSQTDVLANDWGVVE